MNFSEKATPKLASETVLKFSRATADGVMPDKSDAKVQSLWDSGGEVMDQVG